MQDVVDAGKKLGLDVRVCRVDDQGLMLLPKPLVTFVENDHFVSVIKADKHGVSYLCSDCGAWPGGRVNLTWKQWDTMSGSVAAVVTRPGSAWDRCLATLPTDSASPASLARLGVKVASAGSMSGLLGPINALLLLKHVVIMGNNDHMLVYGCGDLTYSTHCCQVCSTGTPGTGGAGGNQTGSPTDPGPIYGAEPITAIASMSAGPLSGDPVNLATGEEEYQPSDDLTVYNPTGPAVHWGRSYGSLRSPSEGWYEPFDFGVGWSQHYNVGVQDASSGGAGTKYLFMENGARIAITAPSVPSSSTPSVQCIVQQGYSFLAEWDYDSVSGGNYFIITMADRTQWVTTDENSATGCYLLSQIRSRNYTSANPTLNVINFNYVTGLIDAGYDTLSAESAAWPLLASITDGSGNVLLQINRSADGNGNITSVEDCYGRFVFYHVGFYRMSGGDSAIDAGQYLDQVSQPVQGFPSSAPPARYTFTYTDPHNFPVLSTITVPSPTGSGNSTSTIEYNDSTSSVSSITDAHGNMTTFTSVDAGGSSTSDDSSPSNYEQVSVTGTGATVPYTYTVSFDSNFNELTRTDAGNSIVPITKLYSDSSNPYSPTKITDANGKVWQFTYDSRGNGNLLEEDSRFTGTPGTSGTEYLAQEYTYSYANFGLGELTQTQEQYLQTGSGSPTVVAQKSPTTRTYYEPSGNMETEVMPAPGTVNSSSTVTYSYEYNVLGDMTQMTTPGNNAASSITTIFSYASTPAIGEPLTITDALGHATTFTYDCQGNKTSMTDALDNETDYSYVDPNRCNGWVNVGQLNATEYPPTTSVTTDRAVVKETYLYPGGPRLSDKTYSETGSLYREVDYNYGAEGEELSVSGSTEYAAYTYDDLYRLATLTDGNSNTTHYYYNAHGYLNAMTYPGYSGNTPSYSSSGTWTGISGADSLVYDSYDGIGDVTGRVDGNGVNTSYTYNDPADLLTGITYPSGTIGNIALTYDNYGRAATINDGTDERTLNYDDNDNETSVAYDFAPSSGPTSKTVSYTYNSDGSRATLSVSALANPFTYSYDGAGRITGLTNPAGSTFAWSYLNNNWLASETSNNSSDMAVVTANYTYNERGAVTALINVGVDSIGTLSEFGGDGVGSDPASMTYDAMLNRLTMPANISDTSYSGVTSYGYDTRNELISESSTRDSDYSNSFVYDPAENPTTIRSTSGLTYNSDNQQSATAYSYDGNGNPTTYNGVTLTFDPENRMTGYGSAETNGYGADGLRTWSTNSSGTTYYLYDGEHPVAELSSSGTVTAVNTFGGYGLVSRYSGSADEYYAFDPQGSTAERISSSGSVDTSIETDAFGKRIASSSTNDPYSGFESQWGYYSEFTTGLELLMHRYYDPVNGRFVTRDPIGYEGGVNLYAYCKNEPDKTADSLGLINGVQPGDPDGPIPPLICPPKNWDAWLHNKGICGPAAVRCFHDAMGNIKKTHGGGAATTLCIDGTGEIWLKLPDGSYVDSYENAITIAEECAAKCPTKK